MGISENANQLLEQYQAQSKKIEQQIDKTTNDITTTLLYRNKLRRVTKSCTNGKNYGAVGMLSFGLFLGVSAVMLNLPGVAISAAGVAVNGAIYGVADKKHKQTKKLIAKAGKVVSELDKYTKSLESEKHFLDTKIQTLQDLIAQGQNISVEQLESIKNQQSPTSQTLKQEVVDFVEKAEQEYYGKQDEGREV